MVFPTDYTGPEDYDDAVGDDLVNVGFSGSGCFLAHRYFLPVLAVAFCAVACDIHAERLLAKAGGSKRKLRGIPTLRNESDSGGGKGEAERRSAQAQRGRLGTRL
jgi:hypothetical protein